MITLRNLYRTDVFRVRSPNPWLADMVRADATEIPERDEADSSREKIEALAEIICGAGAESATALLVLCGSHNNCEHGEALCFHSLW